MPQPIYLYGRKCTSIGNLPATNQLGIPAMRFSFLHPYVFLVNLFTNVIQSALLRQKVMRFSCGLFIGYKFRLLCLGCLRF